MTGGPQICVHADRAVFVTKISVDALLEKNMFHWVGEVSSNPYYANISVAVMDSLHPRVLQPETITH